MLILTFLQSAPVSENEDFLNERITIFLVTAMDFYQKHMLGGGKNCSQPRPFSSS